MSNLPPRPSLFHRSTWRETRRDTDPLRTEPVCGALLLDAAGGRRAALRGGGGGAVAGGRGRREWVGPRPEGGRLHRPARPDGRTVGPPPASVPRAVGFRRAAGRLLLRGGAGAEARARGG